MVFLLERWAGITRQELPEREQCTSVLCLRCVEAGVERDAGCEVRRSAPGSCVNYFDSLSVQRPHGAPAWCASRKITKETL
jgi:hypothetical protein